MIVDQESEIEVTFETSAAVATGTIAAFQIQNLLIADATQATITETSGLPQGSSIKEKRIGAIDQSVTDGTGKKTYTIKVLPTALGSFDMTGNFNYSQQDIKLNQKSFPVNISIPVIENNKQSITGSDYSMYVGDKTPTVSDFKASATDKTGAASEVTVDLSKADVTKAGTYDVTLNSADGQSKVVKLTVKANNQSITGTDYSMYVGDKTPTVSDFKASATDKTGAVSEVTVDLSKADVTKAGTYDVTLNSADGQSKVVKLTVKANVSDTYKVTFKSSIGGTLSGTTSVDVPKGTKLSNIPQVIPNKSDVEDIYFLDWYKDGEIVNPKEAMITKDTTFTAKFGAAVYRLYNKNNGDHLLTKNRNEKNDIAATGWLVETNDSNPYGRAAFYVPVKDDIKGKKQVYRIYNPNSGEHFYSTNKAECDAAVKAGWRHETNEDYTWVSDGDVKMYREFNPDVNTAGSHNFTTNKDEHEGVVKAGWRDEAKDTSLWKALKAGF
ncbi:hypothetical protein KUA55_12525 [Enterococcus sp. ALS3]|uniref:DUF5648 domain-containing protein n=1 Tax=Enterococcus alishanensis TaxID=1303817 RepID=A0ABS6TF72_9ENTE|nr:hypothetical protein [Enterococcus alishanensis]MBV7391507.1 hypothetical protein [Enterococcus alishanensis]